MAVNPQLDAYGVPVLFESENLILFRDGIEFEVDKILSISKGTWKARGRIYLSNLRIVFVSSHPSPPVMSFDLPLLYISNESFEQPIFGCNNLKGKVRPVIPEGQSPSLFGIHSFKFYFKEGGAGTFLPLFYNVLLFLRRSFPNLSAETSSGGLQGAGLEEIIQPIPPSAPPVEEMIRHAYIDPNDPSKLYVEQPKDTGLRRRNYYSTQ